MRHPEPRWRASRKTWVCRVDGKLHTLAHGKENKQQAWKVLHDLLSRRTEEKKTRGPDITFVHLADLFLEWCQRENEPRTYEWYKYLLEGFCSFRRTKKARDLVPQDLYDWFSAGIQDFSAGTRSRAIEAISRVLNWGVKGKIISENPLKGMDRPLKPRREIFITAEQRKQVIDAYPPDDPFRDFLTAMEQTGCRPGEVASVTSVHFLVDQGIWLFTKHKTRRQTGGRPRIIYLNEAMVALTKRLIENVPEGTPLFRNADGNPWTASAIRCRLRRVRKRLKIPGLVAYLYRHGFVTGALERGLSDAVVAQLAGHKDTTMIHKHYSFLSENVRLLREAAQKAVE